MRWGTFVVFGLVALVLDASLTNVLLLRSLGNIAPSFTAVVLVFVSLFAPRRQALWACWALGLLADLCTDLPQGRGGAGPLIGPHALGYAFACFVLLQLRPMLFRRHALTVAVSAVVFALAAAVVAIALSIVHGWYPNEQVTWADLRPAGELLRRFGAGLYTALLAFVLARPLMWLAPLWGFRITGPRAIGRL